MFEDVNNLLFSFASSCLQAGSACALTADSSITSIHVLLAKIETLLDNLYAKPVPAFGLDVPAVATTADLRTLLFHSMYQPKTWVNLAQRLSEAFQGDFSEILKETMPRVHQSTVDQPEFSTFSTHAIAVSTLIIVNYAIRLIFCSVRRCSAVHGRASFSIGQRACQYTV